MMNGKTFLKAPPVDGRNAAAVAEQTRLLMCHYLSGAPYNWTLDDDGGEAGRALTGVFAHLCEVLIERINRAPELHFLAFLDLLGHAPNPAAPARVPLTFTLDASATEGLVVEPGTQVQAQPGASGGEPLVFETERALQLTPLVLKAFDKTPAAGLPARDVTRLIVDAKQGVEDDPSKQELVFDVANEDYCFGLDLATGRALPVNQPVSLFFFIGSAVYDVTTARPANQAGLRVVWSYLNAAGNWAPLPVDDDTLGLTQTGAIEFLLPADITRVQRHAFERKLYWVRAQLFEADQRATYRPAPRLAGVAAHTVWASQRRSIDGEVLGSSSGQPSQRLKAFRSPVLPGQVLSVLERREAAGVGNASQPGGADGNWITWTEVASFHGSGPQDRHYVVRRDTGEFLFGNGREGMIPPTGIRNLRLDYRSGGGVAGNVGRGRVKDLVSGQRLIRQVGNAVAAQGGAQGESVEAVRVRAPRTLRHRHRAVTVEDFEDLALLASPEVARALCVPLLDLALTPCATIRTVAQEQAGAGRVSVVIVPRTDAAKPLPSQVLLDEVTRHLRAHSVATSALSVVGPLYLRVDIQLTVRLASRRDDDRVKRALQTAFARYLHPLTGREGQGWSFGRVPQASDIHRVIRAVDGIDHVEKLDIRLVAEARPLDSPGDPLETIRASGRFLVFSGNHAITTM